MCAFIPTSKTPKYALVLDAHIHVHIHILDIRTVEIYMHTYVHSHYGHTVGVLHTLESTDTTVQSSVYQRKPHPTPVCECVEVGLLCHVDLVTPSRL